MFKPIMLCKKVIRWFSVACKKQKKTFILQHVGITDRAILRGMSKVAFFLLCAKLIAVAKEMLVAYCYGASALVDGYLFVFNLILWPVSVFFSVTSFVLIPHLVSMRVEHPDAEDRFRSELLFLTVSFGVIASFVTGVVLFVFVTSGFAGLTAQGQYAALAAIPWLAPIVAFGWIAALYSFWLMSEQSHANTLIEALPALCVALVLLIWIMLSLPLKQNIVPLVLGTLVGFVTQAYLLAYISGYRFHLAWPNVSSPHWQSLKSMFGAIIFAQIILTSTGMVDQFIAIRMGDGVLSVLSYAQKITSLLLGFGVTVISRAILPVLSGVLDIESSWRIAKRWAFWLGYLGFSGAVVLSLLAKPIVKILFERGAFTSADTEAVIAVLLVLGLQLPFYLSTTVLIQWIGAVQQQQCLLAAAIAGLIAKMVCALMLYDLGAVGLAWSTVVMYLTTALVVSSSAVRIVKAKIT